LAKQVLRLGGRILTQAAFFTLRIVVTALKKARGHRFKGLLKPFIEGAFTCALVHLSAWTVFITATAASRFMGHFAVTIGLRVWSTLIQR
jgi:hypothetical protein